MTAHSQAASPEMANRIQIGECTLNYHDQGEGDVILLIHGSGPGVTGWANWRGVIPSLSQRARVIAPDMLGFGYTHCPSQWKLEPAIWVQSLIGLLDALEIKQVSIVGNSFGGAIALALAKAFPLRVKRLVLMGAAGLSFPITDGLDKVWGYQPSLQAMRGLMEVFAYDHSLINETWSACAIRRAFATMCKAASPSCSPHRASKAWKCLRWPKRIYARCHTRRC